MKVQYQRMYPIGQFLNERIGFEMEIPDDGDPVEEIKTLKKLCDKAHEAINPVPFEPNMEEMQGTVEVRRPQPIDVISQIESCMEIKVLESYKLIVRGFPDRQAAYDKKMSELKNNLG